jgi:hypothetical protein
VQQELGLDCSRRAEQLVAFVKERVDRFVRVALHRNRVTMASVRFERDGSATLRLHEDFRKAPTPVLEALCRYLERGKRRDWEPVQAFAQQIVPRERRDVSDAAAGGQVHDLAAIARDVNERYFSGRVTCHVRWGKAGVSRGRRRSIRYGSWNESLQEVRVHPALDDARVPVEFVAYIVFHEFLHVVVPAEREGGRRMVHGRTFRSLERRFPDYDRMQRLASRLLHIVG